MPQNSTYRDSWWAGNTLLKRIKKQILHFRHWNWHMRVWTSKPNFKPRKVEESNVPPKFVLNVPFWIWKTLQIVMYKWGKKTTLYETYKVFRGPKKTYKWNSESTTFSGLIFVFLVETIKCQKKQLEKGLTDLKSSTRFAWQ